MSRFALDSRIANSIRARYAGYYEGKNKRSILPAKMVLKDMAMLFREIQRLEGSLTTLLDAEPGKDGDR